ncbi:hypothetical protein PLESTM_001635800 [Pleodorina starrii]|nr:hypothetical protein PLESTM_001635800 [Pleodorina starrii]
MQAEPLTSLRLECASDGHREFLLAGSGGVAAPCSSARTQAAAHQDVILRGVTKEKKKEKKMMKKKKTKLKTCPVGAAMKGSARLSGRALTGGAHGRRS